MFLIAYFKATRYMQYLSVISASLASSSCSAYLAWPSPVLPQLTFFSSVSIAQTSWIVSVFPLGSIPGSILGGWLLDRVGRKRTILLTTVILFIPWVVIAVTKNPIIFMIARFIGGMGAAIIPITVPVYTGEIADKDIRGRLGLSYILLTTSGTVAVLSAGPFMSYKWLSIVGAAFTVLCAITFHSFPESPYYLIKINKREEARKSLIRLSANNQHLDMIEERLLQIEKTVLNDARERLSVKNVILRKDFRKSILIVLVFISALLIDKLGRRPLMIISTLGCGASLICEGVYFYLDYLGDVDISSAYWLPTFALTAFVMMAPFGITSLPYVLYGELFTTNAKGAAGTIITIYAGCLSFIVLKSFQPMVNTFGIYVVFWIFACMCLLGTLFGFFILPETKQKSFDEIQDLINRR
ncbi:hypothetical protein RI129_009635 [Pyrocoelia pectoralis]|uniref:Major facilitator superfamily (MFS) profile domain-containing protein n=1 Tax=Pyrocoelia pectoralis TaxID=417401 RepID=A0AAN7V8S5_9COLE